MNLKEAIESEESLLKRVEGAGAGPFPAAHLVLCAAHRQLAAEEAQKPKRASLAALQEEMECCPTGRGAGKQSYHAQAADILKALRETVVPWLRTLMRGNPPNPKITDAVCWRALDMLRALGEEP